MLFLRNKKWLLNGTYAPKNNLIQKYLEKIGSTLDFYYRKYYNIIILGGFNSEIDEEVMSDFCSTHNLKNLVNAETCFKSSEKPIILH